MREIKFRGKRVDNGEWVYGFLSKGRLQGYENNTLQSCIDQEEKGVMISSVVNNNTVGQFTGLTDKSGKKIFEGDIISHFANYSGKLLVAKVVYEDGAYMCLMSPTSAFLMDWVSSSSCEVIGNVHSNPEFLERKL